MSDYKDMKAGQNEDCAAKADAIMAPLKETQAAFAGEAKRLGLESEQDVVALVKEVRYHANCLADINVMCGPLLPPLSEQARQTLAAFLCEEGRLQQGQIEVKGVQPYREFSAGDLRKLREWLGMNQQDFGLLLGVSGESVAEWEEGFQQPQAPVCRLLYLLYWEPELFLQTCLHLRYAKSK